MIQKKFNYFYKITNLINGKYYYGVHRTDDLDDGYMGSGSTLKKAFKKYGLQNFKKEILKFFDTGEEAFDYENKIVNEKLIQDNNCYNIVVGGRCAFDDQHNVAVVDENGKVKMVTRHEYLENDFKAYSLGMVVVKDKDGNIFRTSVNDERYISGELVPYGKGNKQSEEQKNNTRLALLNYYKDKNICVIFKFDENSNIIRKRIDINDFYVYEQDGWLKLADENKNYDNFRYINKDGKIMKVTRSQVKYYLKDGWNKGKYSNECNNSRNVGEDNGNYNKIYIYKEFSDGKVKSMSVPKEQLNSYLNDGWNIGRKMEKIHVHKIVNDELIWEYIDKDKKDEYLNNGWELGRIKKRVQLTKIENDKRKRITVDVEEVVGYVKNGWYIGKLTKSEVLQKMKEKDEQF